MLCTVKRGKKVSCGGVFDLAVEQPQLFRKRHKNKNKQKNTITRFRNIYFKIEKKVFGPNNKDLKKISVFYKYESKKCFKNI